MAPTDIRSLPHAPNRLIPGIDSKTSLKFLFNYPLELGIGE
jgi:hypothetical protein